MSEYYDSSAEDESITSVSDNEHILSASEEEGDAEALDVLHNFVSGLDTSAKRKTIGSDGEDDAESTSESAAQKRPRLVQERVEGAAEGEFGIRPAGPSQLSISDLLKPLSSDGRALSALKKSMSLMQDASSSKNQTLSAPLPTRTQDRVERIAAYEQTKEEVQKWAETMKQIREAEHLSFPLQTQKVVKVSNLELAAKFKPSTDLESAVDRLLKAANLREEDINKTEELLMKDLTIEEVAARRAELRRLRELAFRADAKAKRIAKIKSKTYHRLRKRQRARLAAKLGDDGEEDPHEERLKAEIERAKERATLKHKNTGKWAKAMQARNEMDEDQRRSINEMLDRGERLRRRIQGVASGSEDESERESERDDVSDKELDEETRAARIKTKAFDELDNLRDIHPDDEINGEDSADKTAKSIFEMKFMKEAEARKNRALDREIDDFKRELGELSDSDAVEDDAEEISPVERVNGRMVFRPGPQANFQQQQELLPPPSAISETSTLRSHDSFQVPSSPVREALKQAKSPLGQTAPATATPDAPSVPPVAVETSSTELQNPWLTLPEAASSGSKRSRRKNEVIIGKTSAAAEKSKAVLQKQLKKRAEERELENNDAVLEISAKNELILSSSNVKEKDASNDAPSVSNATVQSSCLSKNKKKKLLRAGKEIGNGERSAKVSQSGSPRAPVMGEVLDEDDASAHSEVEEQEAMLSGNRAKAFRQRELVARAFVGDDVMREFEEAKEKEMEADAPKEIDTTLPGWGSWGGAGTKKARARPHLIQKVSGVDPTTRIDYGKSNVIISEKRDKKAAKYAVKDLPYPFTSKAQYDAAMNTPLGTEWNTRLSFQRATLPRVVKKMGTAINPLTKL